LTAAVNEECDSNPEVSTIQNSPRGTTSSELVNGATRQLTFDALDQLVSDATSTYTYDAAGRLATRNNMKFDYAGLQKEPNKAVDSTGTGTEQAMRDSHGTLLATSTSVGSSAVVADAHGDITGLFQYSGSISTRTQTAKVGFDPFGNHWSGSATPTHSTPPPSSFGYQGDWTDYNTGAVWMQSRWYDPTLQTFLSRDTYNQNLSSTSSLNRYAYGNANPVTNNDPTGHLAVTPIAPPTIWDAAFWEAKFAAPAFGEEVGAAAATEGLICEASCWLPVVGLLIAAALVVVSVVVVAIVLSNDQVGWRPGNDRPPSPVQKSRPDPTPQPQRPLINSTPDFQLAGHLTSTPSTSLGGVSTVTTADEGASLGACGLNGSISSCVLPQQNVISGCASITATMRPCLPSTPQPGTPGRMGASVSATTQDASPQTQTGSGGLGNPPPPGSPSAQCEPDEPQPWSPGKDNDPVENLADHFGRHGGDFPNLQTVQQYADAARNFLSDPPPGTLTINRTSGDVVRYHPESNTLGISDCNGTPRTFYKPDPKIHGYETNMDYFNAQAK
jgi:RHS repeat-associated protein